VSPSSPASPDAAHAMSLLAWTVHVRIPLLCLRKSSSKSSGDLTTVASFLGSYRGASAIVEPTAAHATTDPTRTTDQASSVDDRIKAMGMANNPAEETSTSSHQPNNTDNGNTVEEEEVWAAESDPSDYAFESDYDYQQALQELDAFGLLDPQQLSSVPSDTTWKDIAQAVTSLLKTCQYSPHLVALSQKDWKDAWQDWTSLILTLLVTKPLLQQEGGMQLTGLHVLHMVRDAALDRPLVLQSNYIQLLQTLLQVQAAHEQDGNKREAVAPAAWVGLGALSDLCRSCNTAQQQTVLQTAVMESCDDLTLLLERSMEKNDSDDTIQRRTAIQWTYLAFFQALVLDTAGEVHMAKAHSQTLLQSGLFRQWLLHWTTITYDANDAQAAASQRVVQDGLLDLCASSPVLLGKYAWRFPGFAAAVYTVDDNEDDKGVFLVDRLLWNLLGIHLAEVSSSRIQWKSGSSLSKDTKNTDPPSAQECQKVAWSAFQTLCQQVQTTLTEWKKEMMESSNVETHVITEFGRLVSRLTTVQLLCTSFVTQMAPPADGKSGRAILQACVQPIRQLLNDWPVVDKTLAATKVKKDDDDNDHDDTIDKNKDDDHDDVHRKQRPAVVIAQAVQGLRRNVKTLFTLLLDDYSDDNNHHVASSSKAD
jgi:hypothetical protein